MDEIRVQTYRNYGVFASAGQRLIASAKTTPPLILDLGGFPRTPDYERLHNAQREGLVDTKPDASIPMSEKREPVRVAPDAWTIGDPLLTSLACAAEPAQAYRRIRQTVPLRIRKLTAEPMPSPDRQGCWC